MYDIVEMMDVDDQDARDVRVGALWIDLAYSVDNQQLRLVEGQTSFACHASSSYK